jgi:hypothetical protein
MNTITLDLRAESLHRFNRFFVPSAVVFACASIVLAFKDGSHGKWLTLITGVLIVVQAIIAWRSHKPLTTYWDTAGIRGSVAPGKAIAIAWSEVSAVDAGMFVLVIHLKNQTTVPVDLSQITYKQHKEIKPLILELARTKGVEVRTV